MVCVGGGGYHFFVYLYSIISVSFRCSSTTIRELFIIFIFFVFSFHIRFLFYYDLNANVHAEFPCCTPDRKIGGSIPPPGDALCLFVLFLTKHFISSYSNPLI